MAGPTLRLNLDAMGVKQGARDVNAAFDKIKQGAQQTEVQVKRRVPQLSAWAKCRVNSGLFSKIRRTSWATSQFRRQWAPIFSAC